MQQARGLAFAALIAGIVAFLIGWIPVLGLLTGAGAIVLGILAIKKQQPKALAITGIALGSVAAFASIAMTIAVALAPPAPTPPPEPKPVAQVEVKEEKPKPEKVKPAEIRIPDVSGLTGDQAWVVLDSLGFKIEFDADNNRVINQANWKVVTSAPASGKTAPKGATIALKVTKIKKPKATPEPIATSEPAPVPKPAPVPTPPPAPTATPSGLTATSGWMACERYAEQQYVYGVQVHWILGVMAERIEGDQWFLKSEITPRNEYGTKVRGLVMECAVGGTEESPTVVGFNVY